MGVDQNLQKVVKGGVLLAAVIFDVGGKESRLLLNNLCVNKFHIGWNKIPRSRCL